MADSADECFARAAQARAAATAELLPNAREKHLRSADVWEALGTKARRVAQGQLDRAGAARLLTPAEATLEEQDQA